MSLEVIDRRRLKSRLELNGCCRHLPQATIGNADDSRRRYCRLRNQSALYRLGQYLETTAHDGAVGATTMKQKPVCIEECNIGRAYPVGSDTWRDHL